MAEKNSAQTNKQTDRQTDRQTNRHYENNGHLAVNQYVPSRQHRGHRIPTPSASRLKRAPRAVVDILATKY